MSLRNAQALRHPAYKAGGFALLLTIAVILAALAFQYLGGYEPCELCTLQRYAYYAAIPALFIALVLLSADASRAAGLLFFFVALAFLANAGLGVYHSGVEWKFWPGPDTCTGGAGLPNLSTKAGDLVKQLETIRVVRCDEPSWRLFGLSFAGWNVITSFVIFITALKAAFLSSAR
jgi:disulfide bond formation protein DsbB